MPDPEKVRAIKEMRQPQNTKELRIFLGFMQYLAKFIPNLAEVTAPLRKLLEKEVAWHWETQQEQSFQNLKSMASNTPVLGYYDPAKPVTLLVDASSKGLGAVLLQGDQPIAYASRALTPTQQKYAQIEKETLAIVFGTQKIPPVCLWQASYGPIRPQAARAHPKQTTPPSTPPSSENDAVFTTL